MRFSREGMWGTGLYFAQKASYSDFYAYKLTDKAETKQMFFAKVLIGKYKYLESDKNIKMPPINEETKQRYDSVKGITKE